MTISARGSYRLTSVLSFNSVFGPLSTSFIEIAAQDVDLDLNGFALRCSNVLTGDPCTGTPAAGVSLSGVARRVRIHDGSISGMPGDGVFGVNSSQLQLENLLVSESGRDGLQANTGSRIEGCTIVDSTQQGIVAGTDSILIRNVVQSSGGNGFSVGQGAVVRANTSSGNGGTGFRINGDSLVDGNTATQNQIGFSLLGSQSGGGLARDNVANANSGLGMSMDANWVFTSNVVQGNNGGGAQTAGGTQGAGNYCGTTPGCP